MLVTFKAQTCSDVTMFGESALKLLQLMGRAETLPSAMEAEDIPDALSQLQLGIAAADMSPGNHTAAESDDETDEFVGLHTRALPLIELLQAAHKNDVPVMWEEGARPY